MLPWLLMQGSSAAATVSVTADVVCLVRADDTVIRVQPDDTVIQVRADDRTVQA